VAYGALAALDDRPRRQGAGYHAGGQGLAGVLACDKAKEHGYPTSCGRHVAGTPCREHGPRAGHDCLAHLVQGTVCKFSARRKSSRNKVRLTNLERRDA